MAQRYEITESVSAVALVATASGVLVPGAGATATIKDLLGNNLTVYAAETGVTTATNPITTDASGRIEGWVEAPDYDIVVTGVTSYTQKVRMSPVGVFNVRSYGAKGDGVADDTAAINGALAALQATGGGTLFFPADTYLTAGAHSVSVPCTLAGEGYGTIGGGNGVSVLNLKNGANADVFALSAKAVTIRDLGLAGNKANQTATSRGIALSAVTACNYFKFVRLWVDGFRDDGIFLQGPGTSLEGTAAHCEIRNCGGYGVNVSGASAADCQFDNCILAQNTTAGAQINAGGTVFSSCHIWGNTGQGVLMPSGAPGKTRFIGCYVETNGNNGIQPRGGDNEIVGCHLWKNAGRGVYGFSCTGLIVSACSITDNNTSNTAGAGGAGVNFDTCTASSVTGNVMADRGGGHQKYGYAETGNTCNACLFSGNVSRAADHGTGNWLIGTGNPTATIPATPASYNVG